LFYALLQLAKWRNKTVCNSGLSRVSEYPRVELRLGEKVDSVETAMDQHVICLRHWNKTVFTRAAIHVCVQAAEPDIVPMLVHKLRDH
jgi:hypothetical protein